MDRNKLLESLTRSYSMIAAPQSNLFNVYPMCTQCVPLLTKSPWATSESCDSVLVNIHFSMKLSGGQDLKRRSDVQKVHE